MSSGARARIGGGARRAGRLRPAVSALSGARRPAHCRALVHAHARGYPSGRYGSQSWHRHECGLDVPAILRQLAGEGAYELRPNRWRGSCSGPILVLGASGFIGANLMRALLGGALGRGRHRIARAGLAPRCLGRGCGHHRRSAGARQPQGALGPSAAGDGVRLRGLRRLLVRAGYRAHVSDECGVQAGADRASCSSAARIATFTPAARPNTARAPRRPDEDAAAAPNSHYAVTKNAAAGLVYFCRTPSRTALREPAPVLGVRAARGSIALDSDAGRARGRAPPAALRRSGDLARFRLCRRCGARLSVRGGRCCAPIITAASFNIGSGRKTTIRELAYLAKQRVRHRGASPSSRRWRRAPGTSPTGTPIRRAPPSSSGGAPKSRSTRACARTARWYAGLEDVSIYERASKKRALDSIYSVSAIIACYKDGQAIPVMAERLERDVHETQHRLRDHFRERRKSRRFRGGDPAL